MTRTAVSILFVLCSLACQGQRQPVAPQKLREADIHYVKRTWRIIDLRERQNKTATWPKNPLPQILYDAALSGQLRAYKDDSLRSFFDLEQFIRLGNDTHMVRKVADGDDDPENYYIDTVIENFNANERIRQIMIMEEWYFDNKQGQQRAQIIAIAPLYERTIAGINLGYIPLCWLRYYDKDDRETDCRDLLVNQKMYNAGNPYQKFSYYDWFEQRNFSSFVVKESNPYDIYLADDPDVKRNGLEALIRAARLRQETLEQEHDMYEH